MGKDIVQLETAVSTISQEYLLEFTSEYGISDVFHPELPRPEDRIVDFLEGKVGVYMKFFEFANFRLPLSQFLFDILGYYQIHLSQLSVIGAAKNNRFFWVDERVFPTIVDWRTNAPKDGMPAENTYSPEAVIILNTHRTPLQKQPEALLCLVGMSRRYYLGDKMYPTFLHDDDRDMDLFNLIRAPNPTKVKTGSRLRAAHEVSLLTVTANRVIEMEDPVAATDSSWAPSTIERPPLDFANENPSQQSTGPEDQKVAAPEVSPPENVTTMGIAPERSPAVKERRMRGYDGVDTNAPPKSWEWDPLAQLMRHKVHLWTSSKGAAMAGDPESENTSFASMVAMGSQLRLRFEQEAKLLKKSIAQVARRDKRIQARENEIKNLETLLEAETDMKKAAKNKSAELSQELENMRALFSDLQVGIAKGMREGLKHVVEHGHAKLDLEAIEVYDREAEAKYIAALHALKNLKYPLVDQLEGLKDAPMDVIMASLHLESDTGDDAPQWVRELRPSSSQLTIPVYPEVRDPMDPWACKEEILLADAIAANVSRAEKKKKCRVVCRTHGVGSAHHAQSDGVPVSVPTVAPQGLAILLADVATQTETSDEASPQLLRSSSLHVIHG
nr:hypothetical protein [Tanacetum cinerariifolium]